MTVKKSTRKDSKAVKDKEVRLRPDLKEPSRNEDYEWLESLEEDEEERRRQEEESWQNYLE